MTEQPPVLVAGAGSWGTALAVVLARNNHAVWLWGHDPEHIERLRISRRNDQYLPGIELPAQITLVDELSRLPGDTRDVVIAVPCSGLNTVLELLAGRDSMNICLGCKGLAVGKQLLNHQVVNDSHCSVGKLGVLSGPSFAGEIAHRLPSAVTMAANNLDDAEYFADIFRNDVFRIYTNDDIVGVQVAGAIKNVMAIAAGIADGLGYGANTRAALVTRGLNEITRLGVALGGRQETFMGLAGIGDLLLTCTDDQSRNRRLGLLLAKGQSVNEALKTIGQAVEGMNTVKEVIELGKRYRIDMPISEQVLHVLEGRTTTREAVQSLLAREPKTEIH